MPSQEIAFEYLALALEATRGTAVTPPTHYLPVAGTLNPMSSKYRPKETDGTLAEYKKGRSKTVRRWGELKVPAFGLDVNYAPMLLNMVLKGGVSAPTIPATAVLSRLWTFARTMTADDLKSASAYWGDPNVKILQALFLMFQDFTIAADGTGEDGATLELNGWSQMPEKLVTPPTLPAQILGSLIAPGDMQVWLDTNATAIGTTELTGTALSASLKFDNGLTRKFGPQGPGSQRTFRRVGRKVSHPEATVRFELLDYTQYDMWRNDDYVKLRVRLNGDLIETISAVPFYEYVEYDIYGKFDSPSWGDLEGSNRTLEFTIMGEKDTTSGTDLTVRVQNARTTL